MRRQMRVCVIVRVLAGWRFLVFIGIFRSGGEAEETEAAEVFLCFW